MRSSSDAPAKSGIPSSCIRPTAIGVGLLRLPTGADQISVYAPDGTWAYVNCDGAKDKQPWPDHWYDVSQILASGIAAPNRCNHRRETAKPGEFIFFVRPMSVWEKMRE